MKQKTKKIIKLSIIWMFYLCITGVNAQFNSPTSSASVPESITTITCCGNDDEKEPDPSFGTFSMTKWLRTILGLE